MAIDIGATKTLVAVRSLPLTTEWTHIENATVEFLTQRDPSVEVRSIRRAVDDIRGDLLLVAAGCAAPGPLDAETGVIRHSPNLGWRDVPLGKLLATQLRIPVALDDDGHLGALGESTMGAGRGAASIAYLTFSSGVGCGLVSNGVVHRGDHGSAGEVGHLMLDPAGPRCGCGRRGHVESFAGGRALARRAHAAWPEGRLATGGRAPHDAPGIFAAAASGDSMARKLVAEATDAASRAIAVLAATFDPGRVVIGGAIALGQPKFVRAATQLARQRVLAETGRALMAVRADLGAESVLAGAACLAGRQTEAQATRRAVGVRGGRSA